MAGDQLIALAHVGVLSCIFLNRPAVKALFQNQHPKSKIRNCKMPELPEVETLVCRLRQPVVGHIIEDITTYWKRTIARPAPKEFARLLRGYQVLAIERRAKYLVFTLMPPATNPRRAVRKDLAPIFLLIHLRMSGKLSVVDRRAPREKHDRVVFHLDNGRQLRFNDVRKFGRMWVVVDPEEVTGTIGPEPLAAAFRLSNFRALVQSRSGTIKPLLLNQSFLAGVGNIYADEALWRAGIHPQRKAESLSEVEITALYRSIRRVLRQAIAAEGTDAGDGVIEGDYAPRVYARDGKPCYRCHQPLQKIVVGQRGTHFCPHCQPLERVTGKKTRSI
jgi:formamidopyrimidine-DNA glycosylase